MRKDDRSVCVSIYVLARLPFILSSFLSLPVVLGGGLGIVISSAPRKKLSESLVSLADKHAFESVLWRMGSGSKERDCWFENLARFRDSFSGWSFCVNSPSVLLKNDIFWSTSGRVSLERATDAMISMISNVSGDTGEQTLAREREC